MVIERSKNEKTPHDITAGTVVFVGDKSLSKNGFSESIFIPKQVIRHFGWIPNRTKFKLTVYNDGRMELVKKGKK
jgi:hypothetical protein